MVETVPLPGGMVRATFVVPAIEGAEAVFLVGDFNGWSESAAPMRCGADGSWRATVELKAGATYQYRFRDNQGRWHDDPGAGARAPNPFGGENSVLDLSAVSEPTEKRADLKRPPKKRRGRT